MQVIVAIFTVIFPIFTHTLIVPDEIPTILSVIYSNIPILKKGTDSRLGWGFRLGNRADFQILLELGPQTYTKPLANQGDAGTGKRNALDTLSNTLYAQRQKEKQLADSEGGKWLESWSESVRSGQGGERGLPAGARPGIAVGEIDAKSVIPEAAERRAEAAVKAAELYEKMGRGGGTESGGIESTTLRESE